MLTSVRGYDSARQLLHVSQSSFCTRSLPPYDIHILSIAFSFALCGMLIFASVIFEGQLLPHFLEVTHLNGSHSLSLGFSIGVISSSFVCDHNSMGA